MAKELEISVGSINRLMQNYTVEGLIDNTGLTVSEIDTIGDLVKLDESYFGSKL